MSGDNLLTHREASYFDRLPDYEIVRRYFESIPFVGQRQIDFLHFVHDNYIFTFYNKEYISCLANIIQKSVGLSQVLEVAAGDGMFSYYLRLYGINIHATDKGNQYKPFSRFVGGMKKRTPVEILDAVSAIRKYKPKMVVASWLPHGEFIDIDIFNEKPEFVILIGEVHGCCGTPKFWKTKYWEQLNYTKTFLDRCDKWNLCKTDYYRRNKILVKHSCTILFTKEE